MKYCCRILALAKEHTIFQQLPLSLPRINVRFSHQVAIASYGGFVPEVQGPWLQVLVGNQGLT